MRIQFCKCIRNKRYQEDIKKLLTMCNKEFVPPLSVRKTTVDTDLSAKRDTGEEPTEYFERIKTQSAFLVIEGEHVVGFMSFIQNYTSYDVTEKYSPNIYISTILVHPYYRKRGYTSQMYQAMFKRYGDRHIFTRTWSTNDGHIHVLRSLKFFEFLRIENDRGEGIDTIYFCRIPTKRKFRQALIQYHLKSNLIFLLLLAVLAITFIVMWLYTKEGIMHELFIAFSTSLVASVLCLCSDSVVKYYDSINDEYISSLKNFGIENLQFHKDILLEELIPRCKNEIWITGYRLVMTAKKDFCGSIEKACQRTRGLDIKLLVVPMWSDTYRMVYGEEDVSSNYIKIFLLLNKCRMEYEANVEVRFTRKPMFNDTYKVDDRFVTGPYLHCTDAKKKKITAKDFFAMDISEPKKELYQLVYKDYMSVWEEADCKLDFDSFFELFCKDQNRSVEQQIEDLKSCCGPIILTKG